MDRASPRQRLESLLKTLGEPNGAMGALPRAREIDQEEKILIWSSASEAKLNLASSTKNVRWRNSNTT